MKSCQENPMKAMILRADAADAVQTAHILASKGFQTLCVTSRDLAQAMIHAEMIDLVVMDQRVGTQLTHTLALSAERRNPYVSTIIMTDEGREVMDDLYGLIPSLYALIGTQTETALISQIFLSAVANAEAVARRIDRQLAADAVDMAQGEDDLDLIAQADDAALAAEGDDPSDAGFAPPVTRDIAVEGRRSWGDYADVRPHPVLNAPAMPPRDGAIKAFA
jgi:hypothetical protein